MKSILLTRLLIILSLITVSPVLCGQIPIHDAIKLRSFLNGNNKWNDEDPKVVDILRKYLKTDDETIPSEFKDDNDFTKLFFSTTWTSSNAGPLASVLSNFGNLDVTNLADGFAKFLVKRTKEELNVAFFSRFYELIKKDEYRDARTLFPQTYATLSAIGEEIYNFEAYINGLRESFEKDLNGLLDNLPKVINDGRYSAFFTNHPDLKAACLSAIYIGKGLLNKEHPGKIIADYDISLLNNVNINIKAGVQTLQLFSESFRSQGTDHYWVGTDSLKLLTGDLTTLQIYFGLVYKQAKDINIKFSAGDLTSILKNDLLAAGKKITDYNTFIKGFISQTSALTKSIENISGRERDKISFTDYYDFYNNALNVIEYGKQIAELPGLKGNITIPEKFQDYINIARTGGNIALDINRKNYGSAIINTYSIYSFLFGGNDEELKAIVKKGGADAAEAQKLIDDRLAELKNKAKDKILNTELVKKFLLQYGSFIAAVAQAKNSDDIAKAIEAAALPSGSSRIKRETPFNVSLNAYTGLFIGHESIKGIEDKRAFNTYGVTAPIGVAVSAGINHWSYSLFVSLIDLGAVAAFRFKDDTTAQVPTIKLKNIFSPGAFFSLGIPKTPLSWNFGAQMGPNLRKIDNNVTTDPSQDNNNKIYWRFSTSICVDIPLLNFYTKSK